MYSRSFLPVCLRRNPGALPTRATGESLLRFLDLVCEAYAGELLTEQEMHFFQSQFLKVYDNPTMKGYLRFLRE
jgi:hypothetical protein